MATKKRCLITGGLGFIGSKLVERLARGPDRWDITVVDNVMNPDRVRLLDVQARTDRVWNQCYTDGEVLGSVIEGRYDVVFHLAAMPRVPWSVEQPVLSTMENLMKTVYLVDAVRRCQASSRPRIVFASSSAVYGNSLAESQSETDVLNPQSPYALQKKGGEEFLQLSEQLYGVEHVSLRLFNVYGPGQVPEDAYSTVVCRWMQALKTNTTLEVYGDGSAVRDYVHVSDVADSLVAAASCDLKTHARRVFNVGTGRTASTRELLNLVLETCDPTYVAGVKWTHPRKGDAMRTCADTTASKALGLVTETPIMVEQGIKDTWLWWQGRP